jgi:CheY-like chemotaxis protein
METKTFTVLHFEDDKTSQKIIRKMIDRIGGNTHTESTLLNSKIFLNPITLESIDCIICDYMFPTKDASYILKDLAKSNKPVLFYSSLDEEDFCRKCLKVLKSMPYNFKFVQKASQGMRDKINSFIHECA